MSDQNAQQVGLSIADIANSVQVIDMASARGALRGEELAAVGTLRERLVAFLKAAQPQQEGAAPAEGAGVPVPPDAMTLEEAQEAASKE